jgi:hypothetical protein
LAEPDQITSAMAAIEPGQGGSAEKRLAALTSKDSTMKGIERMVDEEKDDRCEQASPTGPMTNSGSGGNESRKDTFSGKKVNLKVPEGKKVNFHDDDAHKEVTVASKNPRKESGNGGKAATTMVYVKKSNESPMEISTVDETKEEASMAVAAASNGTSRPTAAAAKTTVAQKQANGQSRNVT